MPSEREYELVYIVAPTATDAEVEAQQAEVAELVQKFGGTVKNTDVWGRRKLAYEIGHHAEGIYIVQVLDGPGEMIAELGRRLRVRDHVLRHLTVRVDEDLRKVRRATEKKKATVQRRRAARGKPPLPEPPEQGDAAPASVSPEGGTAGAGDTPSPPAEAVTVPAPDAGTTNATVETSEVQE
jgi:small subunit ribosomal protein S6